MEPIHAITKFWGVATNGTKEERTNMKYGYDKLNYLAFLDFDGTYPCDNKILGR